jgi:hypothetical protein
MQGAVGLVLTMELQQEQVVQVAAEMVQTPLMDQPQVQIQAEVEAVVLTYRLVQAAQAAQAS